MKKLSKKIIAGLVIGIFIFGLMPIALADNGKRKKAGTTPDSFLYGLDVALDNLRYLLAINTDAKARVGLETAQERLMEVREMVLQNKIEAAHRAELEHKKALAKVKVSVDSMSKKHGKETVKKLDEIKKEIEQYENELEQVHANINIEIKSKGNLTAEQKAMIKSVLNSLQNQTADVKININKHKEEIKIKIETEEDVNKKKIKIEKEKAELKVEGDVALSQEAKAVLDKLVANLSGSGEVELELEIEKENGVAVVKKEKIEGHLTAKQISLWNDFKSKAIALVNSAQGDSELKVEIEVEHKENKAKEQDKRKKVQEQINDAIKTIAKAKAMLNANNQTAAANLLARSEAHLEKAQLAFKEGKFGEAFGQANSAEHLAINAIRALEHKEEKEKGIISGLVFDDSNADRIKSNNENGLASWTVFLNFNKNGIADGKDLVIKTNSGGSYSFEGLEEGRYTIMLSLENEWLSTTSNPIQVSIDDEEQAIVNFGAFRFGQIQGMKFDDFNGNGVKDENEKGLENWTIVLNGPINKFAVTDKNGMFSFANLTHGNYTISERLQEGWKQTMPNDNYTVGINSGTISSNNNFGNFKFGEIYGTVFVDLNNNTIKDANESGLSNWSVSLSWPNGSLTANTDANGNYKFANLIAETYNVSTVLEGNWSATSPGLHTIVVTSGLKTQKNFGVLP